MRSADTALCEPTSCQTSRKTTTEAVPSSPRRWRRSASARRALAGRAGAWMPAAAGPTASLLTGHLTELPGQRLADLLLQALPDAAAVLDEGGAVARLEVARARQGNGQNLQHAAGVGAHDDHAVGQVDRLVDVVGHEQDCLAVALPDAQQLGAHDLPRLGVQRPERLVHEQHLRADGQGPRNADALAHAARELVRVVALEGAQPNAAQVLAGELAAGGGGLADDLQAQLDVVQHGAPRQERELLEDQRAVGAGRGDGPAVEEQQQGALAAAAGADDGDELALRDGQADGVEGEELGVVERPSVG